jgi:glycosyltransferase involved in cell wall biosynthesis
MNILTTRDDMRIAVLYSEVMPYTIGVINEFKKLTNCEILLIYWDKDRLTPYSFDDSSMNILIPRSTLNKTNLKEKISLFKPNLIWVSGRMDKLYLELCSHYKGIIPTVMGCDNQWKGNFSDKLRQLASWVLYRRYFSHCWVPGHSQFLFALKIGFNKNKIINNLYSAAPVFFNSQNITLTKKRFLFVGRFNSVKGIKYLIQAYLSIPIPLRNGWKLRLVGTGNISNYLSNENDDIEIYPFQNQSTLIDHACESSVFVLPSIEEPWGVVVHEFAALGMPLLLSDQVGAASEFLINGYNGYLFKAKSIIDLKNGMLQIISLGHDDLKILGRRSRELALRITPSTSAANLMKVINDTFIY